MAALRRLLLGLMLVFAGALATPSPSIEPHSPIDIVVDTLAPQAQAITSSQRALLRRGISPVASWDASSGTLTSLAALVTATRTSNVTMFDSTGKLTYAPNNLLTYSNTFSNAAWTKQTNVAATDNFTTDPLGGSAAAKIDWTSASTGNGFFNPSGIINNAPNIKSIWIKAAAGSGTVTIVDPANTVGSTTASVTTTWTQFYLKEAAGAQPAGGGIWVKKAADSPSIIYVYSAALSAVTYETTPRTADQVITTSAAYYGPRIDYTYSSTPGLLVEGSRTNIALYNRDLTNAAWTKGATATVAKDQTGIDGVANSASSFTGGLVAATNIVLQSVTLTSSQRFQSAYIKRITGSGVVSMTTDGGATWTDITSQIGSSWARATIPAQTLANPQFGFKINTNGDKIAVDFVMNETGAYPTSAVQTEGSSVTRAADSLAAAAYSSNPAIIQYRDQSTGTRARKKLTTFSNISSETAEWIEAIRVYPVGTSSAYLDAHLTVDGAW